MNPVETKTLLHCEDLEAGYGGSVVLRDVSIQIEPGHVAVVVGQNGAGKSTLLKVLSGLIRPRRGRVWVDGVDLTGTSPRTFVNAGIIHVPEGRQVFGALTVRENLWLGAFRHSASNPAVRARFDEVLGLFPRLEERLEQRSASLSGGEQQMLAVGRGLMGLPKLLLVDEPTLGLAPVIVERMIEHFRQIRETLDTTILVAEQNLYLLQSIATVGYQLSHGRCEEITVGESERPVGSDAGGPEASNS